MTNAWHRDGAGLLGILAAPAARAHGDDPATTALTGLVVALLALTTLAYGYGVARRWRVCFGRGVRPWQAVCFGLGIALLALALLGPLESLSGRSFAAHMSQHMVLIALAPPLLLLGVPATALGRFAPPFLLVLRTPLARPAVAFALHAIVVWAWHAPAAFQAALVADVVHALEHTTLFASALLFWWCLLHAGRQEASGHGVAALLALATLIHTGMLGALLTFAPQPLYAIYADASPVFGLSALEDQQLAGLLMWVPGGFVYLCAGLWQVAQWLRRATRSGAKRLVVADS